jgi:D-aminopeptidase
MIRRTDMGLPKDSGISLTARYEKGRSNLIIDVPGVSVGHVAISNGNDINTGVTAILPHTGDIFHEKLLAGVDIINGFGKSVGLMQIDVLGTIETPIIMTNTLSVGDAMAALTKYMVSTNGDIALTTSTVNPVVTECSDFLLSDIRGFHVKEEHVVQAIEKAMEAGGADFEEGAVGSGLGMVCMGLKGGIGSASRILSFDGREHTLGVVTMTNFGEPGRLVAGGDPIGARVPDDKYVRVQPQGLEGDKGSVIMVIATDIPLSDRQLKRVARRSAAALGRVGSYLGHNSGDIAVAFSTANRIQHYNDPQIANINILGEEHIEQVFDATVETVEEAIISSMYHARTLTGRDGVTIYSLREFL